MSRAVDHLDAMVPALLFLCAGVPFAALLDRLGFFASVAAMIEHRFERVPVAALWWLAAGTTAVLNLDTTVVLLTPLYIRLARRSGVDPLPLALIPLLLASLASSVLPESNLTTLIAAEQYDLSTSDVFVRLAPVSMAACIVGWLAYRRRYPTHLAGSDEGVVDRRAVAIGGGVVVAVLVGFLAGPWWNVAPWMVTLVADLVLMIVTRWLPWRDVPVATVAGVSALAAVTAVVVSPDLLTSMLGTDGPAPLTGLVLLGGVVANAVNNLPALFIALDASSNMTWGLWAWLAGINTGAALLPLGALANLLWWRILRDEQVDLSLRTYARCVIPVALPALVAGALTLGVERTVLG